MWNGTQSDNEISDAIDMNTKFYTHKESTQFIALEILNEFGIQNRWTPIVILNSACTRLPTCPVRRLAECLLTNAVEEL